MIVCLSNQIYFKFQDSAEDLNHWRCSVCRRKMSSRICIPQDSTDSNLDVPVLEVSENCDGINKILKLSIEFS